MAEQKYTWDDLIYNPNKIDESYIGKTVFYGNLPVSLISMANENSDYIQGTLIKIDKESQYPFQISTNHEYEKIRNYPCIIVKQEEPKAQYVPFTSKEEFIDAYINAVLLFKSVDDDSIMERLSYYGVWLRLKATGVLFQVTAIGNKAICVCGGSNDIDWKALSKDYEFLDGSPCGKEVKDE